MALFSGKKTSLDNRVQTLEDGQKTLLEQNDKILNMLGKLSGEPEEPPTPKKKKATAKETSEQENEDGDEGEEGDQEDGEGSESEGEEGGDASQAEGEDEDEEDEDEDPQPPKAKKKAKQVAGTNGRLLKEVKALRKELRAGNQRSQAADLSSKIGIPPIRGTQTSQATSMKRSEWSQLSAQGRSDFLKGGGKLTD